LVVENHPLIFHIEITEESRDASFKEEVENLQEHFPAIQRMVFFVVTPIIRKRFASKLPLFEEQLSWSH
jgi:hypothetical protein